MNYEEYLSKTLRLRRGSRDPNIEEGIPNDESKERKSDSMNNRQFPWTLFTVVLSILFVTILVALIIFVRFASPDAGKEAVLIMKPWFFGSGGVHPTPVKTGREFIAVTTEVVYVDMRPFQYEIHFDDFMSKDGVPLDFDAVIRLQVTDSVKLISQFGDHWYVNNLGAEFTNRVRQAVRKFHMNETAIDTTAIDSIDEEVTQSLTKHIQESGLPVKLIQVTVGKANPPDAIKDQRIHTAEQQQRILTESERKKAEDARLAAEDSRARADNAYMMQTREGMKLTTDQWLKLEIINMQKEACKQGTCYFVNDNIPSFVVK